MTIHSFHTSLTISMAPDGDAKTRAILFQYFGSPRDFDLDWAPRERAFGYEANVVAHGNVFRVEEKRRRRDFGDELLEDVSNDRSDSRGWTWRCGSVDFVLFAYPKRFTIWPGPALELAWRQNHEEWVTRYGHRGAQNVGYTTLNVPVPTAHLRAAIARCGAPLCPQCGSNVGSFRSVCLRCGRLSCCAISDGVWICDRCSN